MKSKVLRITVDLILIVLGIVFLVFGIKDVSNTLSKPALEDNVKFSKSYTNVPSDNNFKYIESIDKIEDDNAIIFVGNPEDPWSQVLAYTLCDILKNRVIYYLEDEIEESIPQIVIIKNKEKKTYTKSIIIDGDYDGIPIEYWTSEKRDKLSKLFD